MKIIIYVLCFDDVTEKKARRDFGRYTWARPLRIETTLWLEGIMYESWLMEHEAEWAAYDYVGTIAYSIFNKIPKFDLRSLIYCISRSDLFAFNMSDTPNLLQNANGPHFRALWVDMLTQLGFSEENALDPTVKPFYCNYWIARPDIMRTYCDFYRRAQRALQDSPLQAELWEDAGYSNSYSNPEWCRKRFGVPHYPHHTFLMERLPCIFAHNRYKIGSIPELIKNRECVRYLVLFDSANATHLQKIDDVREYTTNIPNVHTTFICAGAAEPARDVLAVPARCLTDVLIGAIQHCQSLTYDCLVISDLSVVVDFARFPDRGGAHYSGPVLGGHPVLGGAYVWGGCVVLSRTAAEILLKNRDKVDLTATPDVAVGQLLSQCVLPYKNGDCAVLGADCALAGVFCYQVPADAPNDASARLLAQFERPALCTKSNDGDLFGDRLVRDIFASELTRIGDLVAVYATGEDLDRLGLPPNYGMQWVADRPVVATDDLVVAWLQKLAPVPGAVDLRACSFQTSACRAWLHQHIRARADDVRAANPFRARYAANRDVFVYANRAHKKIEQSPDVVGFVWGDGAETLREEFPGLTVLAETDPIRVLQFASTCRFVAVADDKFSFLLETISFDSDIWRFA